ncbi:MAG: carbohydrate kinase [Planctomycetota bacterium]|nr:carbohydrate kinase [Planctomycetota bacterium]
MLRPRIISIGEVLWDLFPDGERFGGAPANFACHAALQGAEVAMVSAVGNDKRGHDAIEILAEYGIDVSLVQGIPDAPTGTVGIELNAQGKPTFTIHERSAWDQLEWNDDIANYLAAADAICFGTLGQRSEVARQTIRQAIKMAAARGIICVVDINLRAPFFNAKTIRESIQLASILKLSDEEIVAACSACGVSDSRSTLDSLRALITFGNLDRVVMTRGAEGAVLVTTEGIIEQPGIATDIVDTVGAGDAFTAAFIMGELYREVRETNLRKACEVAAAACSHAGAIPSRK